MSKLVSEATHLMSLPISGYLMYRCLEVDFNKKKSTDIVTDGSTAKKVAKDVLLIAATCATFLNALIAFGAIPKGGAVAKRLDVVLGLLGLVVLGCAITFLVSDARSKNTNARKQELELGAVGLVLAAVMGASYYFDAGIHVGGRRHRVRGRG